MLSDQLLESLRTEYFKLFDTVSEFDKRLLTVKGWGVTLSLAALGWGFEKSHYGLFLVAALSGLGFWAIEGAIKRHQIRGYVRMRDIEIACYELFSEDQDSGKRISSPLIDWSWQTSHLRLTGKNANVMAEPKEYGVHLSYRYAWFLLAVMMPHLISIVAGFLLFALGLLKQLPGSWCL